MPEPCKGGIPEPSPCVQYSSVDDGATSESGFERIHSKKHALAIQCLYYLLVEPTKEKATKVLLYHGFVCLPNNTLSQQRCSALLDCFFRLRKEANLVPDLQFPQRTRISHFSLSMVRADALPRTLPDRVAIR